MLISRHAGAAAVGAEQRASKAWRAQGQGGSMLRGRRGRGGAAPPGPERLACQRRAACTHLQRTLRLEPPCLPLELLEPRLRHKPARQGSSQGAAGWTGGRS